MGRMLDALTKGRSRREPAVSPAPALHAVWPEDAPSEEGSAEESMPFVEVGGPEEEPEDVTPVAALPLAPEPQRHWMTVRFRPVAPAGSGEASAPGPLARELVAFHQPNHPVSAQYRELATRLFAQPPAEQPRVLLFAASAQGAGTTTVLLNAALTLVRDNSRRVVVVDAHLRRPAVAERLGLPPGVGLREVLAGRTRLEDAVRATGVPGLSVLGAGTAEVAPARLAGEGMRAVLRSLRERHDLVLVDGPHWDGRPEVVALGSGCDAVYLVVPEALQEAPATADLLQVMLEQGAMLRGCVLTSRG
jgi:Mrp family chromosome partitioning ATPase